ncbi:MAG: acyl-CoA synthetase (NDP forming), partial [Archaeoglobaceae archaeon]
MYLEGFTDGRRLFETLSMAKKPVVVLKSGRTEGGKRSAMSHTASISTSEEIFEAVCRQARVVKVKDYDELVDTVKALALNPIPKGDSVAVVQPSGAECVMSADAVEEFGLRLAKFSEKTIEKLYEFAPEWHSINNPIDLYPLIEKSGDNVFFEVLRLLCEDEKVDAIISGIFIPSLLVLDLDLNWLRNYSKPILFTLKDDLEPLREIKRRVENFLPVYTTPERAVRTLKNMLVFSRKFY